MVFTNATLEYILESVKRKMPIGINKEVGARIRKIRGSLSQKDFAKILEVNQATICKYESGRIPDSLTLLKISYFGKVSVEWILHGEEAKAPVLNYLLHLGFGSGQFPQITPETTKRPSVLKVDFLVRAIFLALSFIETKQLTFDNHQKAELIAYIYEYLDSEQADPGEVVIRRLADLIQRQRQED